MLRLKVSVRNTEKLSREQIRTFLQASDEIEFEAAHRQEVYDWRTDRSSPTRGGELPGFGADCVDIVSGVN